MRIGIDTGGTFTDLVSLDEARGGIVVAKQPSVPARPEQAVFDVLEHLGIVPTPAAPITLGTTIATNARLTGSGATVVYVATAGFEDVPFIQWAARKEAY